jgi:hypothetical protein
MTLKEIAKAIAIKLEMSYCWEDIMERLKKGLPMTDKILE